MGTHIEIDCNPIRTIGELREYIAKLDADDLIVIEGLDTDLYPFYMDVIEPINLPNGKIIREVRFCQLDNK